MLDSILGFLLALALIRLVITFGFDASIMPEMMAYIDNYTQAVEAVQSGTNPKAIEQLTISPLLLRMSFAVFGTLVATLWLYFALSEYFLAGSTLGKKVFSLRTLQCIYYQPPRLLECMLRNGIKTMSLLSLTLLLFALAGNLQALLFAFPALDYCVAFYHPRRQTLHDLAVRTCVVEPPNERLLDDVA